MGDDFSYFYAELNYKLIDILITKLNQLSDRHVAFYSTLENYLDHVKMDAKKKSIQWPTHTKDFFPLTTNNGDSYWTGFYTSRPNYKKAINHYSSIIFASSNLYSLSLLSDDNDLRYFNKMLEYQ